MARPWTTGANRWRAARSGVVLALVVALGGCAPRPGTSAPPTAEVAADPAEIEPLLQVVRDPAADGGERMDAAAELAVRGDRRAVPVLTAVLEDELERRTGVWAAVIPALGALGDPRAVPVLVEVLELRDDDWLGREMAATALGAVGDPAAVPALLAAARMTDTRSVAIEARAASGDPRAAPLFVEVLAGGDEPETVAEAEAALVALGAVVVPHLVEALDAPPEAGEAAAAAAARLLGEIGNASAVPALQAAADDPRAAVREAAAEALRRFQEKGQTP